MCLSCLAAERLVSHCSGNGPFPPLVIVRQRGGFFYEWGGVRPNPPPLIKHKIADSGFSCGAFLTVPVWMYGCFVSGKSGGGTAADTLRQLFPSVSTTAR